jgi:hypothetical protein
MNKIQCIKQFKYRVMSPKIQVVQYYARSEQSDRSFVILIGRAINMEKYIV